jgi:hypothetical protein
VIRACIHLPTLEHPYGTAPSSRSTWQPCSDSILYGYAGRSTEPNQWRGRSGPKGGKLMQGKIDPNALAYVRSHMALRPRTDSPALFVSETGKAIP